MKITPIFPPGAVGGLAFWANVTAALTDFTSIFLPAVLDYI
jgi:hypothetical protein